MKSTLIVVFAVMFLLYRPPTWAQEHIKLTDGAVQILLQDAIERRLIRIEQLLGQVIEKQATQCRPTR